MSGWAVVVPVKGSTGKSRLASRTPGLVRALAVDTLTAIAAADGVSVIVVVSADPSLIAELGNGDGDGGIVTVDDPRNGLDAAVLAGQHAVREVAEQRGAVAVNGTAVFLGDLPALRPVDVDEVLTAAATVPGGDGVLADAAGTGTTVLSAVRGRALRPAFGAGSFRRHVSSGYFPLAVPAGSRARLDVDTDADLHRALAAGVGARTAAATAPAQPRSGGA